MIQEYLDNLDASDPELAQLVTAVRKIHDTCVYMHTSQNLDASYIRGIEDMAGTVLHILKYELGFASTESVE